MREDDHTRTEAAAADHARTLGASEAIGGGVEHTLAIHPGPGRKGWVVVCSCGWRSEPLRLVWVESTKARHLKEVGPDA